MSELVAELEPIADHILFQFLDETEKGGHNLFKNKTDWGFELVSTHEDTTKIPRWAKIIGLGPDVPEYHHVGQVVLIEALRWTRQVDYKGLEFARTDPDQILAVDDDS
jgi:hypothetical protein